jgi:hypothetical protein
MTSTGCMSCPTNDQLVPLKQAAIAIFVVVCALIWFVVSWKPMLSTESQKYVDEKQKQASTLKARIQKWTQKVRSCQGKSQKLWKRLKQYLGEDIQTQLESLTRDRIAQYLKLYISFLQVLASFVTFNVTWPSLLLNAMSWIKGTLFLDVVQLPGLSCLWAGVNFQNRLITYTLGPLFVIFAFLIPVVCAWAAGFRRKAGIWEAVADASWKNIMFWVFLVYPIVSLTTLQAFNCEPAGLERLTADFNEFCPTNDSLLRIWSFVFIIVYPIGIPLMCFVSMVMMGVHLVARDKIEFNVLSAIVAKYIQRTTSVESQRIASLFTDATQDDDDLFNQEMKRLWSKVTDGKGNWGIKNIDKVKLKGFESESVRHLLRQFAKDCQKMSMDKFRSVMSMEKQIHTVYSVFFDAQGKLKNVAGQSLEVKLAGIDPESIRIFVNKYDTDKNGSISIDEFRGMVNEAVHQSALFTGTEGDRLTIEQAVALLSFDWKSTAQEVAVAPGPSGDLADFAGIGSGEEKVNADSEGNATAREQISEKEGLNKVQAEVKDGVGKAQQAFEKAQNLSDNADKIEKGCSRFFSKSKDQTREAETQEQVKLRLVHACKNNRTAVAAQIWELGKQLLQNKVISVPDMIWVRSKGSAPQPTEMYSAQKVSNSERLAANFVIHPDLEDDFRITSIEKFLASGSFRTPETWKTVNNRKALEHKALARVGFVFVAYKINFWFWEMIEMLRK